MQLVVERRLKVEIATVNLMGTEESAVVALLTEMD